MYEQPTAVRASRRDIRTWECVCRCSLEARHSFGSQRFDEAVERDGVGQAVNVIPPTALRLSQRPYQAFLLLGSQCIMPEVPHDKSSTHATGLSVETGVLGLLLGPLRLLNRTRIAVSKAGTDRRLAGLS